MLQNPLFISMYTEDVSMYTEDVSMYTEDVSMYTEDVSMYTEDVSMYTEDVLSKLTISSLVKTKFKQRIDSFIITVENDRSTSCN